MTTLELAQQVAHHMANGWTVEPGDEKRCYLVHESFKLYFRVVVERALVRACPVQSNLPGDNTQFPHYSTVAPCITMAVDRGPEKIAREIRSRLLTKAFAYHQQGEHERDKHDAYVTGKRALIVEFQQALGLDREVDRECFMAYRSNSTPGSLDVQVNSPESVKLTFWFCSPEFARKLIGLFVKESQP